MSRDTPNSHKISRDTYINESHKIYSLVDNHDRVTYKFNNFLKYLNKILFSILYFVYVYIYQKF